MMKHIGMIVMVASSLALYAMDDQMNFSHNTYQGRVITPDSLLELAPKMSDNLEKQTNGCMEKYHGLINSLVSTPHPLTREKIGEKKQKDIDLIKESNQRGDLKNLGAFNYVLRFSDEDYRGFTVPINKWGSRVAYWVYASDQGSVLDPKFSRNFDCSKIENLPSYQHCSRVAHYLRLKELVERQNFQFFKPTPTYLKHVSGKSKELSDENYVVVQKWEPDFKEVSSLPKEEQQLVRENIRPEALQEMHAAIVYAALWNFSGHWAVNSNQSEYYMPNLEEPFNHKPQFFFFQGEEGTRKYVMDVRDGLERMAKQLQEAPEKFNLWKRLTEDDSSFKKLCEQQNIFPNYDPEHLNHRD
jgi:hypothetical protein